MLLVKDAINVIKSGLLFCANHCGDDLAGETGSFLW